VKKKKKNVTIVLIAELETRLKPLAAYSNVHTKMVHMYSRHAFSIKWRHARMFVSPQQVKMVFVPPRLVLIKCSQWWPRRAILGPVGCPDPGLQSLFGRIDVEMSGSPGGHRLCRVFCIVCVRCANLINIMFPCG